MNMKKTGIIGGTLLIVGSLAVAASTGPKRADQTMMGQNRPQAPIVRAGMMQAAPSMAQAPTQAANLELVAPPNELPKAGSQAMVTSVAAVAPATTVPAETRLGKTAMTAGAAAPATPATGKTKAAMAPAAGKVKPQPAVAAAKKPTKLFSYVRLLNYSPHPQTEEFLRDKPVALNGKNYHIDVSYVEDWNVVSDDEGYMKKIGFVINLYENEKVVRTLKTPAVAIDAKKIAKGQVLAMAEVAPYKFNIAVDSFAATPKGIKELVFKFDMTQ